MSRVQSFAAIVDDHSEVLILGSMPGGASLTANASYAHPRNSFWPILADVIGVDASAPRAERIAGLHRARLALWDVAGVCVRPGSLDADIDDDSVIPNGVAGLLRAHPTIHRVLLNGGKAAALWKKHVAARVLDRNLDIEVLPSTSPAHAGMSFADKRARWHDALRRPRTGLTASADGSRRRRGAGS